MHPSSSTDTDTIFVLYQMIFQYIKPNLYLYKYIFYKFPMPITTKKNKNHLKIMQRFFFLYFFCTISEY